MPAWREVPSGRKTHPMNPDTRSNREGWRPRRSWIVLALVLTAVSSAGILVLPGDGAPSGRLADPGAHEPTSADRRRRPEPLLGLDRRARFPAGRSGRRRRLSRASISWSCGWTFPRSCEGISGSARGSFATRRCGWSAGATISSTSPISCSDPVRRGRCSTSPSIISFWRTERPASRIARCPSLGRGPRSASPSRCATCRHGETMARQWPPRSPPAPPSRSRSATCASTRSTSARASPRRASTSVWPGSTFQPRRRSRSTMAGPAPRPVSASTLAPASSSRAPDGSTT